MAEEPNRKACVLLGLTALLTKYLSKFKIQKQVEKNYEKNYKISQQRFSQQTQKGNVLHTTYTKPVKGSTDGHE